MDDQIPERFSIDAWRTAGFAGFTPLLSLDAAKVPPRPGVYVMLRPSVAEPVFEPTSCGGWFKGKDPSVPASVLAANWVAGTHTVYIGKAGTSLSRRLTDYRNFGQGRTVGHWGGRLIWHLADRAELLVCWRSITDADPGAEESRLIDDFRAHRGARPFANLRD